MKIALVRTASNILKYGSYNIQEIGLAKSLLRYDISTDIYARFSNIDGVTVIEGENNEKVTLKPLKGKRIFKEIMYYPSLKKELCNEGYDVVQLLDDSQMMLPFLFKSLKRRGIKTILWQGMYRDFDGKIASLMQKTYDFCCARMLNEYSDLKIAKTKHAKKYLLRKRYDNIVTLQIGLDIPRADKNYLLEKKVVEFKKKHSNILLYVGSIEDRRNVKFIIELLEKLKGEGFGLVLIGKGPNVKNISNKIKNLNIKEQVLWIENVPNYQLVSIYQNSNMFLLPTKYEIYGMVVLEALHYGIPVISSPEAGPFTILENLKLGACENLEIEKWIKLIDFYTKNYNSIEDSNYRTNYIKTNFNWDNIGANYYEIINDLTN